MKRNKSAQTMMSLKENSIVKGAIKASSIFLIIAALLIISLNVSAQITGGGFEPQKQSNSAKADENLRSVARINPSTLAMEFSLPLMSYPGRSGNSLPVSISYSSKLWEMKSAYTWWYPYGNNQRRYVTDTYAEYGKYSAAGWTSSLQPPRLDSSIETYNINGKPYGDSLDVGDFNTFFSNAIGSIIEAGFPTIDVESLQCGSAAPENPSIPVNNCVKWNISYKRSETYGEADPTIQTPTPNYIYYVKRLHIVMPDGSSHEFRQNDTVNYCGDIQSGCSQNYDGTYLSTDGSAMRLEYDEDGEKVLYLANGGKYVFPAEAQSLNGLFAEQFIDPSGNKVTFTEETDSQTGKFIQKTTDTMGRTITEPIPHNWETQTQIAGTEELSFPGFNGDTQDYQMKWEHLKPVGCEEDTSSNCTGENNQTGGALEDQTQKLYYETGYFCQGSNKQDLLTNPSNPNDPVNEVLFPNRENGIRPCNGFNVERDSKGDAVLDTNGNPIPFAVRFNPIVLSEITLPNGKKYIFKYNRYGEISKIVYPTGSYETFVYDFVEPMTYSSMTFTQTNRGVSERKVYDSNGTLQQKTTYDAELTYTGGTPSSYKITTIGSKGDNANSQGMKSERFLHVGQGNFGFTYARAGMPYEEKTYDENGTLRSRTLTEYISKDYTSTTYPYAASRDVRVSKSVSTMIEGDKALATFSEVIYDDSGSTDPTHFSHLNVKQSKSYHYKSISVSNAESASFSTLAVLFTSDTPAAVSETDYTYNSNYKARGIASLPTETRVLNPANTNEILAKTQTIYDNQLPSSNTNYTYSTENYSISTATNSTYDCSDNQTPKICWQNPNSTYLARPTTSRVWDKDTNTWIESHTKYDIFGNAVKVKDAIGNEASTTFTATYKYSYPETVITPAPDPTNTTGTSATSQASTVYDFMTGLPLSVTDDFGRITKTEYTDALLRPTRTYAYNYTAPESQTIYDDTNLWVKVRKQIDTTNWDEAITYVDSLGRTVKTQAKDSQGDVFVETEYDLLGRVKRTTNPYRLSDVQSNGDGKFWTNPRYDASGRVYETCASVPNASSNPNAACPSGTSTGVTSYAISVVTDFVGTVVTSTDASGRKSRSITNALGQLIRIDEATQTGGTEENDLGSLASPNQPTFYTYSPQGQMVKVQQGKTGDATIQYRYFKYDSLGRLIRVRQPEQEVNANLNLSDSITGNSGWTAGFAYDVIGNLRRTTDATGVNIINEYDKANRVIRRCYTKPQIQTTATSCVEVQTSEISDTTAAVSFFYDGFLAQGQPPTASPNYAKGQLTRVTSSVSDTRYTSFDSLGRLTQSQQITDGVTYTSGYEYNFAGALVKETYPSGREVKIELEADGDLSRIFGKANSTAIEKTYANSFSYTADGRIEKLRLGNGLWESAKFNSRLQVTEFNLGIGVNDASRFKLQFEYGELNSNGTVDTTKNTGNIAKQTSSFAGLANPFVQTFKYDSLYRLTEAVEKNGTTETWKQTFGYDRFGNRTAFTNIVGGQTQTNTNLTHPSIDAATNRFNANQGYVYDKNGNITTDPNGGGRNFTFNAENKQTVVKDASNNTIGTYYYDGEGKRVKKVVPSTGETTVFVYSNGKLVAEYSTATPPTNPTTSYTMTDQLDSPRVITNASGEVTSRRDFKPFGEEVSADSTYRTANRSYGITDNIRQKFTGYQKDTETQLDFAEARMYQNLHGRFTAVDPLLASGKSANPQTFNRYVYVINNPLVLTDPSGLQANSNPDSMTLYPCEGSSCGYNWSPSSNTLTVKRPLPYTPADAKWNGPEPLIDIVGMSSVSTIEINPIPLIEQSPQETSSFPTVPLFNESLPTFMWNLQIGRTKGTLNFFGGLTNIVTESRTFMGLGPSFRELTGIGFNRFQYSTNSQAFGGYSTEGGWFIGSFFVGGEATLASRSGSAPRTTLFHYTSEANYNSILAKGEMFPSVGVKNARFGTGQYFTDIAPGQMTIGQTSRRLFGQPWGKEKSLSHFLEIDVTGVNIINPKPNIFLRPSNSNFNVGNRIVNGGPSFFRPRSQ